MKTIQANDVFTLPKGRCEAAVITTNGITRRNGYAVMGRGVALSAKNNFPYIDRDLGRLLRKSGNQAYNLGVRNWKGTDMTILTMPTKNHWRDPSDLELIKKSAKELVSLADSLNLTTIYLPRPGCQNGHLEWDTVKATIEGILDDRFIVCLPC